MSGQAPLLRPSRPNALSAQTKAARVIDMGLFVETSNDAEERLLRWLCHQSGFRFKTGGMKRSGERIFVTQKMWAQMMGIRDPKKLSAALSSLRRQGIVGNDREPGRDGYAVTEHFLSDDFISWTGLVWDTLWNKDGEYPGLMGVWKRAEQEGQEFYRVEDLMSHYHPERFSLISASRKGWASVSSTAPETGSPDPSDEEFAVSHQTPQTGFAVSHQTPQTGFAVSHQTPPKEERAYKENGLTENGSTTAPWAQSEETTAEREDMKILGRDPDSDGEMPESSALSPDEIPEPIAPSPDKKKIRLPVAGTHKWLMLRFEQERAWAKVGTARYNHMQLRRLIRSLREEEGLSYAEMEVLVRVFFAKDPDRLRAKVSEIGIVTMFQQEVPQLILQTKSRLQDQRDGLESSAERSARLGEDRRARMRAIHEGRSR